MNKSEVRFLPLTILLTSLLMGCTSLSNNRDRILSYSFTDTQNTELGRAFNTRRNESACQSGFLLLNNGLDAFVARAAFARGAERSIDDMDLAGRDLSMAVLDALPNFEVRIFNSFSRNMCEHLSSSRVLAM